ncbi:DUF721 domain-containing protein [Rhodobium gokarnense]|uniref:DUF721 domain-containing protein n=1 Tax=Rhodobium gokarnense TaxID=364296 RepID=A0ABT3HCY2_9HYPH|nr:DciA family protein [Rhodobium gokarnense]MCW2308230.1 hypothetical protein [Rhodobium gokarnense]
MASEPSKKRRGRAMPLAELIGGALAPACRKRGFAAADILTHWPDIVGVRYGAVTQPEKLSWPRHDEDDYAPATLHLRCEGAAALLLQHELPQILERINGFLGWRAVDRVRIVQRPLARRDAPKTKAPGPLDANAEAALAESLEGIDDDALRAALDRLGRATLGDRGRR